MKRFKTNLLKTVPVMAGYLVLGAGFGIVLQSHGYGVLWALGMSVFIYAGSMQFVAINLISAGAGLISVALTTLMVNARHLFYGISMIDKYRGAGKYKPYIIFGLTDETYSLVCSDETMDKKDYFQVSILNQAYWVTGSVIGSVLGSLIPWDFNGVDFALTALFVTVFTEQWLSTKDHLPGIFGVVISVACLLIFGAGNFLIPSMIGISIALVVLDLVRKKVHHE